MTNLWKTTEEKWTSTRFSTICGKRNGGKLPCGKLKLWKSGKRCVDGLPAVETLWIKKHDK